MSQLVPFLSIDQDLCGEGGEGVHHFPQKTGRVPVQENVISPRILCIFDDGTRINVHVIVSN
jgi:hypothetical protein